MVTGVPHGVPKPGNSGRGVCARSVGNVMGSRPDGFTRPVNISAIAWPPACPGYQACIMALTLLRHGIDTGLPLSKTTMVLGLAVATASIKASCPQGSE